MMDRWEQTRCKDGAVTAMAYAGNNPFPIGYFHVKKMPPQGEMTLYRGTYLDDRLRVKWSLYFRSEESAISALQEIIYGEYYARLYNMNTQEHNES